MKKSLILLNVLLLFFEIATAQTTFFRIYESPEYNTMYSVAETSAQDFILCGYKETFQGSNFNNAQLLKINKDGGIIQESQLESNQYQTMFSTLRRKNQNDGSFFIVGKKDSIINNIPSYLVKIWEIDDMLNFASEFTINFGDSCNNIPQAFINQGDSIIFIQSVVFKPQYSTPDFSLLKINLDSNSSKYYIPPQHSLRNPTGILFDTINQQIRTVCVGNTIKDRGMTKLFSFDLDLNLISTFEPDFNFANLRTGLSNYFNDTYILSGILSKNSGEKCLYNLVFDNNNLLIDSLAIYCSEDTIVYPGSGNSILVLDSCSWTVGIFNMHPEQGFWPNDPTWIQLNKSNPSLELIEQKYYGGDGYYIPYDIISTNDGGIMIVGNYYNPNAIPLVHQRDPFVLKVNSDGLIVNVNNPEKPIAQEAIVLPNPGSNYLQVKLAIQHKTAHFQLFDINGRLVLEENLQGDMQRVSTSSLNSGTYIYRITASNRVIGSGKWVKD